MSKKEPTKGASAKGKKEEEPCVPPPNAQGTKKAGKPSPEDDYAAKLDLCLTDVLVKTGSGTVLGAITSALFFRRRRWPVIAGMGMGIGLAWANCEHALNPPSSKALTTDDKSKAKA